MEDAEGGQLFRNSQNVLRHFQMVLWERSEQRAPQARNRFDVVNAYWAMVFSVQ